MDNQTKSPSQARFAISAWSVLICNILVILWGAVVRATRSGNGCGEHWPLCQGAVIPNVAKLATLIEFFHRATSGLVTGLVLGLLFLAFRCFRAGHPARRYAGTAVVFTFTEGLIGAALVLFGGLEGKPSTLRVCLLCLHLANTFLLLASLALTANSAKVSEPTQSGDSDPGPDPGRRAPGLFRWYLVGAFGTLAVAMTGTIAALADTLFHSNSLAQSLRWDLANSSNLLIRLRILHPAFAVGVGTLLLWVSGSTVIAEPTARVKRLAQGLFALVFVQFSLGVLNLLLLTPVVMQILHLLAADLIWITIILLLQEVHELSSADSKVKAPVGDLAATVLGAPPSKTV